MADIEVTKTEDGAYVVEKTSSEEYTKEAITSEIAILQENITKYEERIAYLQSIDTAIDVKVEEEVAAAKAAEEATTEATEDVVE